MPFSPLPKRIPGTSWFALWRHRLFMSWSSSYRRGVEHGAENANLSLTLSEKQSALTRAESTISEMKVQLASLQAQLATTRREATTHQTLREAAESREQEARRELIATLKALRPDIFREVSPIPGPEELKREEGTSSPVILGGHNSRAQRESKLRAVLQRFVSYADAGGTGGLSFEGLGFEPSDDPTLVPKPTKSTNPNPEGVN